jgi:hypothetical protein
VQIDGTNLFNSGEFYVQVQNTGNIEVYVGQKNTDFVLESTVSGETKVTSIEAPRVSQSIRFGTAVIGTQSRPVSPLGNVMQVSVARSNFRFREYKSIDTAYLLVDKEKIMKVLVPFNSISSYRLPNDVTPRVIEPSQLPNGGHTEKLLLVNAAGIWSAAADGTLTLRAEGNLQMSVRSQLDDEFQGRVIPSSRHPDVLGRADLNGIPLNDILVSYDSDIESRLAELPPHDQNNVERIHLKMTRDELNVRGKGLTHIELGTILNKFVERSKQAKVVFVSFKGQMFKVTSEALRHATRSKLYPKEPSDGLVTRIKNLATGESIRIYNNEPKMIIEWGFYDRSNPKDILRVLGY